MKMLVHIVIDGNFSATIELSFDLTGVLVGRWLF